MKAANKWDVRKLALAHKIGLCGVGQTSVIIAVSSAHRREALEVAPLILVLVTIVQMQFWSSLCECLS